RYVSRTQPPPPAIEPAGHRELLAVREIVHAFLRADRPEEVFQFALDRVSPVVGASFASVYLVDGASELMKLAAAFNWPEKMRPWLGEIRVRVGFGPSGEAASERRAIEIPDVFADPDLEDWHDVAREIGFRAIVALPLQTASRVLGTVAFYFTDAGEFTAEKRGLLRIVADQMAATAEKAELIDQLRRANAALVESNAELERQYLAVVEARRVKDEFLANVSYELRTPLTAVMGYLSLLHEQVSGPLSTEQADEVAHARAASERLLEVVDALLEYTALRRGTLEVTAEDFDPRVPLRDAIRAAKGLADGVQLVAEEPVLALPPVHSDRRKITRILVSLLSNAFKFTTEGEVRVSVGVANGRVEYRVIDTGIGIDPANQAVVFDEFRQVDGTATRRFGGSGLGLALSRGLARLLGGDITLESAPGQGSTFTVSLPLDVTPSANPPAPDGV
ncbi:MAG: GAF domain-containing sensor histidine kinase, partial [Gemmatimonadetes bacterium]|nr:GAF domain-containing sensor histidine kinase [Gemmatimonadota bacterium]